MSFIRKVLAGLVLLSSAHAFAAGAAQVDQDYKLLNPAQPTSTGKKIEVLEFFFYGCPHCYHLHPFLSAWEKQKPADVELILVPTVFNPSWEPMANTFYALQQLGKQKDLHDALYDAWHQNQVLTDADQIADFVGQHGVDRNKFAALYHSFSVDSKVARGKQMVLDYQIEGTPTLVVDGKYVIVNKVEGQDTIRTLNEVIAMARKERAGKH